MRRKTFPADASGFVPAPDILIEEYSKIEGYGYVTALVWGKVWRYCQMKDGVCTASLKRLGDELGMSEKTIQRHVHQLVKDGYLEDITPNLRNKPHVYRDTGKLKIKVSVSVEAGTSHPKGKKRYIGLAPDGIGKQYEVDGTVVTSYGD